MVPDAQATECPTDQLTEVLAAAQADEGCGLDLADRLLSAYPRDARLHFLRGSLLAGMKRYEEARQAMQAAVDADAAFAVARFQLGLLELTSGDPLAAEATWSPLQALSEDHYLRLFATGLGHLIRDEFAAAIDKLQEGIAQNTENPVMNRDMQLMMDETQKKLGEQQPAVEPTSAAQLLLQRLNKDTRH